MIWQNVVKDVEDFANASKDPEHRDNVILVATDHRGLFKDLEKDLCKDLKKFSL